MVHRGNLYRGGLFNLSSDVVYEIGKENGHGGGFSPHDGSIDCPTSGLYRFTFSGTSFCQWNRVYFNVNGKRNMVLL